MRTWGHRSMFFEKSSLVTEALRTEVEIPKFVEEVMSTKDSGKWQGNADGNGCFEYFWDMRFDGPPSWKEIYQNKVGL